MATTRIFTMLGRKNYVTTPPKSSGEQKSSADYHYHEPFVRTVHPSQHGDELTVEKLEALGGM
jgi:hypothetical protein